MATPQSVAQASRSAHWSRWPNLPPFRNQRPKLAR